MKKDLTKNIITKIKKENIKVTPKYYFTFINIIIWLFFCISIFLGGLAFSIIFSYLFTDDFLLYKRVGFFLYLKNFLPIFWLLFLIGSSILGYINFKNTSKGYKFPLIIIISLNLIISIILGSIIFKNGLGNHIENSIKNNFHMYNNYFVEDKEVRIINIWQNEDNGLLLGEIIGLNGNILNLKDSNGKIWEINLSQAQIMMKVRLIIGEKIKIFGGKISDNNFNAIQIRPYIGGMGMMRDK